MNEQKMKPCVLSIAGSDSSGGAGIQADIKSIEAQGCYAATVLTALTAQNTLGVHSIYDIDPAFVKAQGDAVFSDLPVKAVKIGMLHRQQMIETVAALLDAWRPNTVVLDPVMVSKNGSPLLQPETIECLKTHLFPKVFLITPNLFEAEQLLGCSIVTREEQDAAALELGRTHHLNVLVKGGHLSGSMAVDVLYQVHEDALTHFEAPRLNTRHTHGTGCTLSAAIAAQLALAQPLPEAIHRSKVYLYHAIVAAVDWSMGEGCGPVSHFFEHRPLHQ